MKTVGIRGLTDEITPRLPTIGRLHKGRVVERLMNGRKVSLPEDLDHFRFTSTRLPPEGEQIEQAFVDAYGPTPRLLPVYLPYADVDANFATCCEEWRAGGLVHRCDGETMYLWQDEAGAYHTDPRPCPYALNPELRTRENPGCRRVGRLNVILPALVQAGWVGSVVLVTTSTNDIINIYAALRAVADTAERRDLRGILWSLKRVPERISTPAENGRRRRQSWLVQIEPSPDWVRLQLEIARRAALGLGEEEPPPLLQEPDWEDITHPGLTRAQVEAAQGGQDDAGVEVAEVEPPGFFADLSAEAHEWLERLRSRVADAGAADPSAPDKREISRAAMLLREVWPDLPGPILDERRRAFTAQALPRTGRLSTANRGEVRALLEAIAPNGRLSEQAAAYIRAVVEPLLGQTEMEF